MQGTRQYWISARLGEEIQHGVTGNVWSTRAEAEIELDGLRPTPAGAFVEAFDEDFDD